MLRIYLLFFIRYSEYRVGIRPVVDCIRHTIIITHDPENDRLARVRRSDVLRCSTGVVPRLTYLRATRKLVRKDPTEAAHHIHRR